MDPDLGGPKTCGTCESGSGTAKYFYQESFANALKQVQNITLIRLPEFRKLTGLNS
jgi:Fe-S cluster biogenesis protein NfuA